MWVKWEGTSWIGGVDTFFLKKIAMFSNNRVRFLRLDSKIVRVGFAYLYSRSNDLIRISD